MLKKLVVSLASVWCLALIVPAQSGRRVSQPSSVRTSGEPKDPVYTEDSKTSADATPTVGYSESSPNTARRISARPVVAEDDKKSKKKDKKQNQATAPATIAAPTAASSADDEDVVKIETNLISVPVSVFDRNGLYIPNLRQKDFKIFEDGKEQEVAYFGTSDKPFTVILLLDTSPSTAYKIEEIRAAAIAFVDQLKPQDKVSVIEFDGNVHVLTEATGDRAAIYKAINRADFGGGTALYDAVDFSLHKRLEKVEGRKAIVLFTDGVDTYSHKADYEMTVDEAEEADAMIFPIYYNTFLNQRGIGSGGLMGSVGGVGGTGGSNTGAGDTAEEYRRGRAYLNELATVTGGKVFRPESTPGGLTAAFEGIAEELRRQYNVGYYPSEAGTAGQRKQIKVRVNRPNLVIRARDSYIVGAAQTQTTQTSK